MDLQKNKANLSKQEFVIPVGILDDLSSRFIINVPQGEKKDLVRVLFQIELAHWFYIDFYCQSSNSQYKSCGLREFALALFRHIPFLTPYVEELDRIIEEWRDYKFSVPTYGAILLDENLTHVLLVQSYWSRSSWGFPKGKINKDEAPCHCAIREVYEETGFNISQYIDPDEYIEAYIHDQLVRLYIITGVSKGVVFKPRTRNEIKSVNWFLISDLPSNRKDASLKLKTGINNNGFFMVAPFIRKLRQWIVQHSYDPFKKFRRHRYKSCGDIEGVFLSLARDPAIKEDPESAPENNITGKQSPGSRSRPNTKKDKSKKVEDTTQKSQDSGISLNIYSLQSKEPVPKPCKLQKKRNASKLCVISGKRNLKICKSTTPEDCRGFYRTENMMNYDIKDNLKSGSLRPKSQNQTGENGSFDESTSSKEGSSSTEHIDNSLGKDGHSKSINNHIAKSSKALGTRTKTSRTPIIDRPMFHSREQNVALNNNKGKLNESHPANNDSNDLKNDNLELTLNENFEKTFSINLNNNYSCSGNDTGLIPECRTNDHKINWVWKVTNWRTHTKSLDAYNPDDKSMFTPLESNDKEVLEQFSNWSDRDVEFNGPNLLSENSLEHDLEVQKKIDDKLSKAFKLMLNKRRESSRQKNLSERLKELEIKSWKNFKFDMTEVFKNM